MVAGSSGVLSSNSVLIVNGTLDMNGNSLNIGTLSSGSDTSGDGVVTNNAPDSTSTLTVDQGSQPGV